MSTVVVEIPAGARAIRFLDTYDANGDIVLFSDFLTRIAWSDDPNVVTDIFQQYLYLDRVPTNTCALEVPPVATHLHLTYEVGAVSYDAVQPFIVEWVLAPAYK